MQENCILWRMLTQPPKTLKARILPLSLWWKFPPGEGRNNSISVPIIRHDNETKATAFSLTKCSFESLKMLLHETFNLNDNSSPEAITGRVLTFSLGIPIIWLRKRLCLFIKQEDLSGTRLRWIPAAIWAALIERWHAQIPNKQMSWCDPLRFKEATSEDTVLSRVAVD